MSNTFNKTDIAKCYGRLCTRIVRGSI